LPNYRRRLYFGTLLDPAIESAGRSPDLAHLSESLGYDLVVVRDDSGTGAPLDAWTTLAWIAGRTETIRLAALVPRLHRRLPTVTGRQIASLDLLSGGRAALALGPVESLNDIEALGETIALVRAIVDAGEPGAVASTGPHFPVLGAQRGPLPLHTIPIWLSGNALPLLELAGQEADGWIGTPDALPRASAVLDAAATAAGREPSEIERLVIVRAGDDLVPLVLDHGAGSLLLATSDPAEIEQFAQETIPAIRAEIAHARSGSQPIPPAKPSRIRAKRHAGIAYDAIPPALREHAVEPGDTNYARLRSNYLRGGSPGLILQPGATAEVAEAIAFAQEHRELPLSVRSRGHGISGRSTNEGGLIIDLRRMNRIEILDEATRSIRVGPGARWLDVARALEPYGWALSSGDYGGVGVGGLATAGGVGWLVREHGLTIDHLRAAQIVLADGSIVNTSKQENPDLFWAIRGAGANMGIVTSFDFAVDPIGQIGWAQLVMDATDTAAFLQNWGSWIEHAPRDTTSSSSSDNSAARGRSTRMCWPSSTRTIPKPSSPACNAGRCGAGAATADRRDQLCRRHVQRQRPLSSGQGEPAVRSGLLNHITPEFAASAEGLIRGGASYFFQIRAMGGAVADIPPDATAFANRSANFSVVAFGASRSRLNAVWDQMESQFDGLYLSFETDTRPERLLEAFPEPTLGRLRTLKNRYDPANLFRDNFSVAPSGADSAIPISGNIE